MFRDILSPSPFGSSRPAFWQTPARVAPAPEAKTPRTDAAPADVAPTVSPSKVRPIVAAPADDAKASAKPAAPAKSRYRADIDGMRTLAVCVVTAFHVDEHK